MAPLCISGLGWSDVSPAFSRISEDGCIKAILIGCCQRLHGFSNRFVASQIASALSSTFRQHSALPMAILCYFVTSPRPVVSRAHRLRSSTKVINPVPMGGVEPPLISLLPAALLRRAALMGVFLFVV